MEAFFLEKLNAKIGLVPVDANDGANSGLRVDMKNVKRAVFLFVFGDSTAAVTDFDVKQHDAASAGNSAALATLNPYYYKVHGASPSAWTKVAPTVATSDITPTALAGDPGMVAIEVLAEDLNRESGYEWASVDMADSTAAKLCACIVLVEPVFKPGYEQEL